MAYNTLEAYNPSLWGISQEAFDAGELLSVKLYDVYHDSLQPTGTPINKYPFFYRTKDTKSEDNPLSYQFFSFGMASIMATLQNKQMMFSHIEKSVRNSSLIAYGTNVTNGTFYMTDNPNGGSMGTVSGDGYSANYVSNNAFNNGFRWYSNVSSVGEYGPYGTNRVVVKYDRHHCIFGVELYVCPAIEDYDTVSDESPYTTPVRMTLKEYLLDDNQKKYPFIQAANLICYYGTETSRSLTDLGLITDVETGVTDIYKKTHYNTLLSEYETSAPEYGNLDPAGIIARSYLPSISLYQGFTVVLANDSDSTAWVCCRGLNKHNIVHWYYTHEIYTEPRVSSFFSGTIDDLRDALDKLGMPWTEDNDLLPDGDIMNDPRIHVPITMPDGTTNGHTDDPKKKKKELDDHPHGSDSDPTDWGTDNTEPDPEDPDDPHFDPEEDPENDKETEEVEMGDPKLGTVGVFNRCYAVNATELEALSNYLWNVDETTFEKILKGLQLIGVNPIDAIISVILFPFEIADGQPSDIRIGVVDTEITGVQIDYTSVRVFDLGTCYFYRKYKNYLDYEPYTTASLYIPYVGVIPISVAEYTRKYINVKMAVDLLTGSGQVVVYAGGIPVIYRNCKVGCQIAVTGQDSSRIASNYINAVTELASGVAGVAGGVASGNAMGALGSAANIAKGGLDFYTAGNVPIESRGCDSPQCGFFMPQRCYLIVNRPRVYGIDESIYAKSVGIACYETGNIGSFHGFSKFENVRLDISVATEEEKEQIKSLLASGVYLP